MREPPMLVDATLRAVLQTYYGLSISALTFLPIGNDAASFVYRVDTADGMSYFLKVRTRQGFRAASLLIPRFLYEQGISHIITPIPTMAQKLWAAVDDFVVTLYPFLNARTGTEAGLSAQHWHELGATLQRIHAGPLSADLQQLIPCETFVPWRRHVLDDLESFIASPDLVDRVQRKLSRFWQSHQDKIWEIVNRCDALADELRQASLPNVLCHADIHTWNILLDAEQQIWIVDWDETMLAPKERDLMFVIGGIAEGLVSEQATASFLKGYGDAAIDHRALTYYRCAWAVQEMAAYAEDVFFAPHLTERARRGSLAAFIDIFAPGNIAAIANASAENL
jgi:spectinomycin phosphotransferase